MVQSRGLIWAASRRGAARRPALVIFSASRGCSKALFSVPSLLQPTLPHMGRVHRSVALSSVVCVACLNIVLQFWSQN